MDNNFSDFIKKDELPSGMENVSSNHSSPVCDMYDTMGTDDFDADNTDYNSKPFFADDEALSETETFKDKSEKYDPFCDYRNGLAFFCYSQPGEYHIMNNMECQDKAKMTFLEDKGIILCVAGRGLGSECFSGCAAETTVNSAESYIINEFSSQNDKAAISDDNYMKHILMGALVCADKRLGELAEEINTDDKNLSAALTIAVYDGRNLYYVNAGNNGIIAMNNKGFYDLITECRYKEETDSIHDLHDSEYWQFGKYSDIASFVVMTSGVLESVLEIDLNSLFLDMIFTSEIDSINEACDVCFYYYDLHSKKEYRRNTADDITMAAAVNSNEIISNPVSLFNRDQSDHEGSSDALINLWDIKENAHKSAETVCETEQSAVDITKTEERNIPSPKLPEAEFCFENNIGVFAFSQRGQSHIETDSPCQDRCSFRYISDRNILICAIADGVGSCAFSDHGSYCAVNSVIDIIEEEFSSAPADLKLSNEFMGALLRKAMRHAYDSVKSKAEKLELLLYHLQSTLTVAVYDGDDIYFAHAGDDGIVALQRNGQYNMVTVRHKGTESSSVYPLQSTETWQFGKVMDVKSFVMATDGVLDAFVKNEFEENRIYLPFIEDIFNASPESENDIKKICDDYYNYMSNPQYRNVVRDDLTLLGVINCKDQDKCKKPVFDKEEWNRKTAEYTQARKKALYNNSSSAGQKKSGGEESKTPQQSVIQSQNTNNRHPIQQQAQPKSSQSSPQQAAQRPPQQRPIPQRPLKQPQASQSSVQSQSVTSHQTNQPERPLYQTQPFIQEITFEIPPIPEPWEYEPLSIGKGIKNLMNFTEDAKNSLNAGVKDFLERRNERNKNNQ